MITFLSRLACCSAKIRKSCYGFSKVSEYFDPVAYNPVFEGELEKLLGRIHDPEARKQIEAIARIRLWELHRPIFDSGWV